MPELPDITVYVEALRLRLHGAKLESTRITHPLSVANVRAAADGAVRSRSLTDPQTFSGIGNAYSDEILHRARLSPIALTHELDEPSIRRLYDAIRVVLPEWIERLRAAAGADFPERVTAFHPDMAVHGRFGQPCPVCSSPVQRIRYAENETNYCPKCQTGGRILADRSLSRLLEDDWPRTIDELG